MPDGLQETIIALNKIKKACEKREKVKSSRIKVGAADSDLVKSFEEMRDLMQGIVKGDKNVREIFMFRRNARPYARDCERG
jgi:hypothetical protein